MSAPINRSDWEKLAELYLQPWFTRVWVYQEVTSFAKDSASNITVAYGESRFGWDDLVIVTTGLSAKPEFLQRLYDGYPISRHKFPSNIIAMIQKERNTHFSQVTMQTLGDMNMDFLALFFEMDKIKRTFRAVDSILDVSSYHGKVVSALRGAVAGQADAEASTVPPGDDESMILSLEMGQLRNCVREALKEYGCKRVELRMLRNRPASPWSGGQFGGLWRHLQLSRQLFSTDPRDKIFAFLGHLGKGFSEDPLLKPDYEKSVADVFIDVTLFFIQRDMCLSIFELIHHKPRDGPKIPGLPSWANDWTQTSTLEPFDLSEFCTGTSERSGYSKHALRVEVSADRRRLRLPVYLVGRVNCLTKDSKLLRGWYINTLGHKEGVCWDCVWRCDPSDDLMANVETDGRSKSRMIQDLFEKDDSTPIFMDVNYPTGGRTFDAFLRTFVMNQGYCDQNVPLGGDFEDVTKDDRKGNEREDEKKHGEENGGHSDEEDKRSDDGNEEKVRRIPNVLLSMTSRYLLEELRRDGLYSEDQGKVVKFLKKEHESDSWYGFFPSRRMCFTDNGLIGWVPGRAEASDTICVIPGARTPYVIRESEDGWEMIGAAYVHGLMDQLVDDSELCLTERGKRVLGESAEPIYISLV